MPSDDDVRQEMRKKQQMRKEHWLCQFCNEDECKQVVAWLREEGLDRPDDFERRLERATYLREIGNDWYKKRDYRRSLLCALGVIHYLDFTPKEQLALPDDDRRRMHEAMARVLTNTAAVFLQRGDFVNTISVADTGLRCMSKLPGADFISLRAKLLYRRGLARGEPGPTRDLKLARSDLYEAARLEPQNSKIRTCLETCKEIIAAERDSRSRGGDGVSDLSPSSGPTDSSKASATTEGAILCDAKCSTLGCFLRQALDSGRSQLPLVAVCILGPVLAVCFMQ